MSLRDVHAQEANFPFSSNLLECLVSSLLNTVIQSFEPPRP